MSLEVLCSDKNNRSELSHAILVYKSGSRTTLATIHDVEVHDKKPMIKAGKLLSKIALKEMFETLTPQLKVKPELLPENILGNGENFLAWYMPPQNKSLWFKCADMGGEVSGVVPLPGLVFMVSKTSNQWYVFACKGKDRPNQSTELFNAPFLNVWAGGHVCEGSSKRPKQLAASKISEWEDVFFRSRFTHTNQNHTSIIKYKAGAYKFWSDMLANKWKKFPESLLVNSGVTLSRAFDDFIQKGL